MNKGGTAIRGQKDKTTFHVGYARFLDADGKPTRAMPEFAKDARNLVPLYRAMVLTRTFDEKAVALQRTGRLGTFASSLGQEAVAIGVASAMRLEDVFLPSFREQGAQFWRGVTLKEAFLYWGGDERGNAFEAQKEDFPICVPVGTQFPHAAGVATAFQLRGEQRVAVVVGGDGATSKGDFYEALNIAGVWKLPAVFIINNNQWAISVPRSAQTAAETLAQKAIAAGMPGEQADGNDVLAVHDATSRAIERARSGGGPSLMEAVSYRLSDHTTADDARRYRKEEDVSAHWKEDPVARLRAYLVSQDAWSKTDEETLIAECVQAVVAAVDEYLSSDITPLSDMFEYQYSRCPPDLQRQRDEAVAFAREAGDE